MCTQVIKNFLIRSDAVRMLLIVVGIVCAGNYRRYVLSTKLEKKITKLSFCRILMLGLHYEIQSADRILVLLSADKHHFVGRLERLN